MNTEKADSFYQNRPQVSGYLERDEVGRGVNREAESRPQEFAAHPSRLSESIRIKLLKVLTLTLLRELEGVGSEPVRAPDRFDLQSEVQHFEAELIRSALIMTGGRQRRAARLLGMKVTTLHSKIRRHGLQDAIAGDLTNGHEPSAIEAVRTSLELVEAMFEPDHPDPTDAAPEIHVTGEN